MMFNTLMIGDMTMYTRNNWLPEVFNDFFDTNRMPRTNATAPAINVLESATQYTVELAAPGLKKEDFDVNVNADGDLTIKMERQQKSGDDPAHYLRREFAYAKFEQTLILPDDVDRQKITARVADGVLTVDLPKVSRQEQQVVRSIEVG
ncbi:small heat shock protein [Prevotella dentalis DSM 3688]|uniref:Small heat shock protein n=3 Tax=Prevotellaceae TaxID=171552 RepID=F9D4K2_PREDD|nr:small heat shock protein [Prevotella dentalis DSM 3688]